MRADYLLMGRDVDRPCDLHIFQSPTIKGARKEAKRRVYWTQKRIYKLHEVVEEKNEKR